MRFFLAVGLVLSAFAIASCGDGSSEDDASPTATVAAPTENVHADAQRIEADDDPSLPGEYVDIPGIYNASYGGEPNTAPHVREAVDYSPQGLPPAGGPHWGAAPCSEDPLDARPPCGPASWGIYRDPWPAEPLVHNMEHAGVVIWYDTSDEGVLDQLEDFAVELLQDGVQIVLTPYPQMQDESVAITVWTRRLLMPVDEFDIARLAEFVDVLYCRFDPEQFCS